MGSYDHWKATNPADAELGSAEQPDRKVEVYEGFPILRGEDGFHWQEGGYFETVEECREDIHDWNASEAARDEPRDDTPSLGQPWWAGR